MEETKEIWKAIEGYEGLYEISTIGRVKSLQKKIKSKNGSYRTVCEKILKPIKNRNGYLKVVLYKKGKMKNYSIHRLVASAFIHNDSLFNTDINHKDENPLNNNAENLEWCDRKYNCNFGTRNERLAKAFSIPVKCLETGYIYPSTMYIERELGFNHSNIVSCCNGKRNTCGGFHWKYVD